MAVTELFWSKLAGITSTLPNFQKTSTLFRNLVRNKSEKYFSMNQQRLSGNKSRETVKEIEEIRMNYMTQPQHTSINTQQFISKSKMEESSESASSISYQLCSAGLSANQPAVL